MPVASQVSIAKRSKPDDNQDGDDSMDEAEAQEILDDNDGDVQAAMDEVIDRASRVAARMMSTSAVDDIMVSLDCWRRRLEKAASRSKKSRDDNDNDNADNDDVDNDGVDNENDDDDDDNNDDDHPNHDGDDSGDAGQDCVDKANEGLVEVCLDMLMQHQGDRDAAFSAMIDTNPLTVLTQGENQAHEKALDEACIRYRIMENAANQADARAECARQNALNESDESDESDEDRANDDDQ